MDINGVGNGYGGLARLLLNQSSEDVDETNQGLGQTSWPSKSEVAERVQELLAGIEPGTNGKITMKQVLAHKDELFTAFEEKVKDDLRAMGVDEDIEFTLGLDATGQNLVAITSHEDKSKVDQYLAANPDLADQFRTIRTLSNLTSMAQSGKSPAMIKQELQMNAVALFSQVNQDLLDTNVLLDFGQDSLSLSTGLNTMV